MSAKDPEVTELIAFAEEYRKSGDGQNGQTLRAENRKSYESLGERLSQLVRQDVLSEADFRLFQFIRMQAEMHGPEMDGRHRLMHRLDEAEREYRRTELSARKRLSLVARKLGWIVPGRRNRHYPDSVATDFELLTEESGTVLLKDLADPDTRKGVKFENCPLEPGEAIAQLAKRHGFGSSKLCLQFLRRRRDRWDEHRRALSPYKEVPSVRDHLASLPKLDNLPFRRKR